MQILAHRTAMANAPPNSLEGFKFCWTRKIGIVECDLSFTKDGQPIIWHDEDNHRLKRPAHSIGELTFKEIRELERSDFPEKLLTLEDLWVFLKTHPGFRVLFDVKYYHKKFGVEADFWGVVTKIPSWLINLTFQHVIYPAVAMNLTDQIGFVTFDGGKRLLQDIKNTIPRVFTSLMVIKPWAKITDCLEYIDIPTIAWGWRGKNHWRLCPGSVERLVSEVHRNGRKIWGGLARGSSDMEWLIRHGFDGAWVDDIEMARQVLAAEI